jgi:rhamnosyltransferase subunit B
LAKIAGMTLTESKRRIILTTFGSFGDLHPFLAIAEELQRRGHTPVVATVELYREKVEAAGFEFRLVRTGQIGQPDRALIRKVMHLRTGPEFIIRQLVMPSLRLAYEDTLKAAEGADLLVAHPLTFATPLVAEMRGIPWASTQLAPMSFLSPYDPPVLPGAPLFDLLSKLGPAVLRPLIGLAKRVVSGWTEPYRLLRAELGLPPVKNPMFEGGYSPALVLALFSEAFAQRQPDWPAQAVITGFPFYDHDGEAELQPALRRFLDAGEPPIVFTLGSSAVMDPGQFYRDSAEAARRLGRRAVLLVGREIGNAPALLPEGVAAFDYAQFSELFPRAAAVVHQGGVGTTGQAMRAGIPMLVMPYAVDQPDNGARASRLGIGRVVARTEYSAERATHELSLLLMGETGAAYRRSACEIAQRIAREDGAAAACDRLEELLEPVEESDAKTRFLPKAVLTA